MNKEKKQKMILVLILCVAVITGFVLTMGMKFFSSIAKKGPANPEISNLQNADKGPHERKIIYWRAPMDPMEIYDKPGQSKMGMDLVPVYEDDVSDDTSDKQRKIVYWKAPMDPTEIYEQPGKSRMGMDLVPVYEDELMGGVDIKIDPIVEQNMGLKTEAVQKGLLQHTIKTYGNITFDETKKGVVSQRFGGWIEKLYADYTGFYVEKGQPLYEIYSPELLAAQEEYLSAYKNYKKNPVGINHELHLSARVRLSYFGIADQEILAIEKNGQVRKNLLVRSPFTGVVTHKNVTQGSYVKKGESLYTIADLSHVWVEAHIFEYEQNVVFKGQAVEMTLSYNPDKVYKGKIAYIFPYLQQKTRDVIIRIDFENKNNELKPDMFAKINIKTGREKQGLSISSQAVIHSGEEKIVFVSKGKGKYTPRKITLGLSLDDDKVQVLSGLSEDEIVVTSGQFLLDSESRLKEAIQKMIESKSAPEKEKDEDEAFFNDMTSEKDGSTIQKAQDPS
ncbi:MAG: efflux RND transporter periplasmic adaptor subunit [Pseudomonadota bacterium]